MKVCFIAIKYTLTVLFADLTCWFIQVCKNFGVLKTDQHLYAEGKELTDDNATLCDLRILPDSSIYLKVSCLIYVMVSRTIYLKASHLIYFMVSHAIYSRYNFKYLMIPESSS